MLYSPDFVIFSPENHETMAIDSSVLQSKLKHFFGFDAFKGDQERIIRAAANPCATSSPPW